LKTKEEISKALGVDVLTVLRWRKQGCPAKKVRGAWRFDIEKVQAWLESKNRDGRPGRPVSKVGAGKAKLELALIAERVKKAKLEREEAEGKLHSVKECKIATAKKIYAVKNALLNLPRSAAGELVGKSAKEIEASLADRINRIIDGFASETDST